MKILCFFSVIALATLTLVSCTKTMKKPESTPPADSTGTSGNVGSTTSDVYVCGADKGKPVYWKNGQEVALPASQPGFAKAICVHGSDVFVVGQVGIGAEGWKNGQSILLSEISPSGQLLPGTFSATGVCFYDSSFYVSVSQIQDTYAQTTVSYYLRFGIGGSSELVGLSDIKKGATVDAITVLNGDVYCAGAGTQDGVHNGDLAIPLPYASVYKNGGETFLKQPDTTGLFIAVFWGYGTGITTSGTDIYVSGNLFDVQKSGLIEEESYPVYWKNNMPVMLSDNGYEYTTGICIQGNDVYISGIGKGEGFTKTFYWKNGNQIQLDNLTSITTGIQATSNGDVYISGNTYDANTNATAVLWKNGAATVLGVVGNSQANGILIATK